MKLKFNKNTGITLIALVVTIIVLLILAGITLSLALNNNGIIGRSKNAATAYKDAELAEREELDNLSRDIDDYIKENQTTLVKMFKSGKIKVGDYINYKASEKKTFTTKAVGETEEEKKLQNGAENQTFTVENNKNSNGNEIKWRVLGLANSDGEIDNENGNSLALIADESIEKLKLNGAESYEYGIDIVNKASEIYKNDELAINARSIKMEDIINALNLKEGEKVTGKENYKGYVYNKQGEDVLVVYKMNTSLEYEDYIDSSGNEHKLYSPESYLKGKTAKENGEEKIDGEMLYGVFGNISSEEIGSTTIKDLLFRGTNPIMGVSAYWLGSRGIYCFNEEGEKGAAFGLGFSGVLEREDIACNLIIGGWSIFLSDGGVSQQIQLGLRPIVVLKPDITMEQINS